MYKLQFVRRPGMAGERDDDHQQGNSSNVEKLQPFSASQTMEKRLQWTKLLPLISWVVEEKLSESFFDIFLELPTLKKEHVLVLAAKVWSGRKPLLSIIRVGGCCSSLPPYILVLFANGRTEKVQKYIIGNGILVGGGNKGRQ
jgi:hypothetical protein